MSLVAVVATSYLRAEEVSVLHHKHMRAEASMADLL